MKRVTMAMLVVQLLARSSFGQVVSSTTGAINGVASDNTGAVVPGVTVTIAGASLMGTRTDVTDTAGFYRFAAVPPGDYKITFELTGFSTIVREGVHVGLGFTATINVELRLAAVQENVTVSGASPVVDTQATKVTESFSADKLNNLPGTREYWSMLSAMPAVAMGSIDVGGSQAMIEIPYTVYGISTQHRPTVEGIVSTWGTGGSDMYYADFGSFSETALNPAGNNAEAPTPGMQSTFVSKSGGNSYHGMVYLDYENENVQSHNIDAGQIARGVTGGTGIQVDETNRLARYRDFNADVGGFLVKDRLWWYYSYRHISNAVRLVNLVGAEKPTKDPVHSLKVMFNTSKNGHLTGYLQHANKIQRPWLSAFRVGSGTAIYTANSAWDEALPTGIWKAEYNHVIGSRSYLEVRTGNFYSYWKNKSMAPTQLRYEDIGTNIVSGGNRNYQDLRDRPQLLGSLSYFKDGWFGKHNFKVGGEILNETDKQIDGGFPGDVLHVLRNGAPNQIYVFQSPNEMESGLWTRSAYTTDAWRLNNRLTLNLGARLDQYVPYLPAQEHQASANNPTAVSFAEVNRLITWNNFAPRIGGVYSLTANGKTVVKMNYGIYWYSPASDFATALNPNQPVWYNLYTWTDSNTDGKFQTGEAGQLQQTNGGVASQRIDPNLKDQYTAEIVTMVEREVARNFGIRTGLVWLGNRNLRAQVNQNQPFSGFNVPVTIQDPGPDGRVGTSDDGQGIPAFNLASQYLGLPTQNLTQNLAGKADNFYTWEITGSKRMSDGWSFLASFAETWNQRDVLATNPNALINTVDGQNRFTSWQAKASGTFELPKGFRVSPLVRHQSGTTFARTFAATLNYGSPSLNAELFSSNRNRNVTVVDLRGEKGIRLARQRLAVFFDVYNLFNTNPESSVVVSSGTTWLRPVTIVPPRIAKVGVKFEW